jgi:hypothetical protein
VERGQYSSVIAVAEPHAIEKTVKIRRARRSMNFAPKISENLAKMIRNPTITIISSCLEERKRGRGKGNTGVS